ncbi:MAG: accessory factor UbiK family protein [Rhodobacterales bacterium]|nr:accessory factor UbiK family protein [Rhodobacterales bacterium]
MQTNNRLFDDLAKVANGAVSTLVGVKDELEALVRQQIERLVTEMDLVPRDEFDAVRATAVKAREEQEALAARVAELEARLDALAPKP